MASGSQGPPPASADREGEAAWLHRCGALGDVCEEVIQVHRPGHRGAHLPPEGDPLPATGRAALCCSEHCSRSLWKTSECPANM